MLPLLNRIANGTLAVISLVTATGVFMHDGRVDKAAMTAMQISNYSNYSMATLVGGDDIADKWSNFIATDAHTHPDHNAARSVLHNYQASPSIPPREQEHKRHLLQRFEPRGRHAFDNYNLPIIEETH